MAQGKGVQAEFCKAFCTYYKPGKSEDLACEGVQVLQSMRGRSLPSERPGRLAVPDGEADAVLHERVCGPCSFRAQDCDHIATGGRAPSCGGLAALRHLLGSGEVKLSEIKKEKQKRK